MLLTSTRLTCVIGDWGVGCLVVVPTNVSRRLRHQFTQDCRHDAIHLPSAFAIQQASGVQSIVSSLIDGSLSSPEAMKMLRHATRTAQHVCVEVSMRVSLHSRSRPRRLLTLLYSFRCWNLFCNTAHSLRRHVHICIVGLM